ncbi:hypothetical protein Y1Q_0024214 [Alligator mississippiensis]|uniref:Uncharacterized protein n=1 Tax=Alligator mississippiensis TaxID=8496 RepID=A0A151NI46_ALLMI|nr:hypothetical protein Y1Q_0024214 [Alligator mississippiensis]
MELSHLSHLRAFKFLPSWRHHHSVHWLSGNGACQSQCLKLWARSNLRGPANSQATILGHCRKFYHKTKERKLRKGNISKASSCCCFLSLPSKV